MRAKHLKRREKNYRRGWFWVFEPIPPFDLDRWVKAGRKWQYEPGGKQDPLDLLQSTYTHGVVLTFAEPFWGRVVDPAEYRKPPVPRLTSPIYLAGRATGNHQRFQAHGYHRRRVFIWKRPPGRMKGDARKIWLANAIYMGRGWFPDWDILDRHPKQSLVAIGEEEPVEDAIWPGGMPPH